MNKIEDSKKKFREMTTSAPITNNLRNLSEQNIKNRIESFKQKDFGKPKVSIKEEKTEENIPLIGAEVVSTTNDSPIKTKKKKKKKQTKAVQFEEEEEEEEKEEEPVEEEKQVDWDALNEKNSKAATVDAKKEPELDVTQFQKDLTYAEAKAYFTKNKQCPEVLTQFIEQARKTSAQQDAKPQGGGIIAQLFSCLRPVSSLATAALLNQKDQLFAISYMKFLGHDQPENKVDYSKHIQHHQIINTIYRFLTGKETCPQIGEHWQKIGFQQSDPRTDIRGCGMLGLLHVLFFIQTYPLTFKMIYEHSLKSASQFPLMIKMFEFTSLVLVQIRNGGLYPICNQLNDVFKATSTAYCCLSLVFIHDYIRERGSIVDMDALSKRMKADIKSQTMHKYMLPWISVNDAMMIEKLSSSKGQVNESAEEAPKKSRKNRYEAKEVENIKEKTKQQQQVLEAEQDKKKSRYEVKEEEAKEEPKKKEGFTKAESEDELDLEFSKF